MFGSVFGPVPEHPPGPPFGVIYVDLVLKIRFLGYPSKIHFFQKWTLGATRFDQKSQKRLVLRMALRVLGRPGRDLCPQGVTGAIHERRSAHHAA